MLQSEYQGRWFKTKRFLITAVCCIIWQANVIAQATIDTFHVYFDLNMPVLNESARQTIDSLLYHDALKGGKYTLIVGYADYLGNEGDNHILSEKRAKYVYEYLAASGISKDHIRSFIGKGAIERELHTTGGYPKDRRVDIVIGSDKTVFTHDFNNTKTPVQVGKKTPVKSRMDIIVDSLKVGQTFLLDNLYFYPGRHTIREESILELDNLYNVLNNNPGLKIKIEGHVCCVPDDKDALDEDVNPIREQKDDPSPYFLRRLSLNRAMYINYYLVKRGIDSKRMQYEGYGRSRPVVKQEKSMADENKNRRVEIRIIEK